MRLAATRLLVACALLAPVGCGPKSGPYIQDLHVEPERVVSASQKVIPLEVAYYMPTTSATRTEAVALAGEGNFRSHVGELLDGTFRENLAVVYGHLSVLPNDLFSEQQRAFDYPGYIVPQIREVAINPVNQTVRLVVDIGLYIQGRRKVGELNLTSQVTPLLLDPAGLSRAEARVMESGSETERLSLALRRATLEIVTNFILEHPKLLKPVKSKGKLFFVSGYRVPMDVDFKPSSPTHLRDAQALNGLKRILQILREDPTARIRVEVHAFDYLGKPTENIPKILAPRRGKTIRDYLVSEGAPAGRIDTASFQDFYPIADNTDLVGWDKNDRVDIVVLR